LFFVRQGGASVNRDFIGALLQLNAEKGVPQDILLQTLEQAIESAYRRNAEAPENVVVKIDPETGEISVYREYEVVAGDTEVTDPELQKTVSEAIEIEPGVGVGGRVRIPENVTQAQLGRIAAQTAGQVYRQRLREAERDVVYHQYVSREGEILTGVVTRTTESAVVLDMGRGVEAVLSVSEQLPGEHYRIGQHLKVFVLEVRRTTRGPVLVVSRTHRGFLRRLMEMEIPEIYNGSVVIRGIAREAGSRSKVAVESRQPGVDAKGAAVGQRGTRIQAIVAELNGEKVDVVLWNEDPSQFVAEALSPAEVIEVRIDEEHRIANVIVPERQLSLAIGREGQNARLAAKLTGWRIDIRSDAGVAAAGAGGARVAPSSSDGADGPEGGAEGAENAEATA
jgi:N utilization substance protein A